MSQGYVAERSVGVDDARSSLGRLMNEVAETGSAIALTKRGRAQAVLVSSEEYWKFKVMANREAREELRRRMDVITNLVAEAGLDPAVVDEAVAAARAVQ